MPAVYCYVLPCTCSGLIPVLHGDGILEAAGPDGRYRDGLLTPAILSGGSRGRWRAADTSNAFMNIGGGQLTPVVL
jgi:hypothetical protein